MRKVEEAGYDPDRLPPGQYLTEKWPVLHAGTVPNTDLATWDFRVFGEVESPVTLSWDEFLSPSSQPLRPHRSSGKTTVLSILARPLERSPSRHTYELGGRSDPYVRDDHP